MNTTMKLAIAAGVAALTLGACSQGTDETPAPTTGEALPLITEGTPSDWYGDEPTPVQPPDYATPESLTFEELRARVNRVVPFESCDEPFRDMMDVKTLRCHPADSYRFGNVVMFNEFNTGESSKQDVVAMDWGGVADWPTFLVATSEAATLPIVVDAINGGDAE